MKYSWEFKLECVKNYKIGKSNVKPECAKCNQKEFSHKVREWVRTYELHGIDGLKHKPSNKEWTKEEKFDLVSKALAGNSIKSISIGAGIDPGLLHKWVKKYKHEGFNGLESTYTSFEEFAKAIDEYIHYFNNNRIQSKTKWMSPVKYRETSICLNN